MLQRLRGVRRLASPSHGATLAFEEVTLGDAPQRTAVMLHGLLGQARNWRTFARKLLEAARADGAPATRIVLPDLRCHGNTALRCACDARTCVHFTLIHHATRAQRRVRASRPEHAGGGCFRPCASHSLAWGAAAAVRPQHGRQGGSAIRRVATASRPAAHRIHARQRPRASLVQRPTRCRGGAGRCSRAACRAAVAAVRA